MMNKMLLALALGGGLVLLVPATAQAQERADVLLIEQAQKADSATLPRRGMTMAQVEQRFGAPLHKLDARGGDAPQHPTINRWQYADYIVYFERDRVIHAVLNPPPAPDAAD